VAEKLFYRRNVFMLNIGGDVYEINEPGKFDQVLIEVIWDEKLFGYRFEFSDAEVQLEFDRASGYDLLKAQYQLHRSNADVSLHFGEMNGSTVTIIYEAKLNFSSYVEDHIKIKLTCERRSFSDKFKNYYDTKVDVKRTTTLNDSLSLSELEGVNLFLHPRLVTRVVNMVYDQTIDENQSIHLEPIYDGGSVSQPSVQAMSSVVPAFTIRTIDFDCAGGEPTESNIDGIEEYLLAPDGIIINIGDFPDGITKRMFYFNARVSFKFSFDGGGTIKSFKSGLLIRGGIGTSDISFIYLPGDNAYIQSDTTLVSAQSHGGFNGTVTVTHNLSGFIEVSTGYDRIFTKCFFRASFTGSNEEEVDSLPSITNFQFVNTNDHFCEIMETTTFPPSLVGAYQPFELVNRQLEIILDTTSPLKSNLLGRTDLGYASNGCASSDLLLDGLAVRGFRCYPFNMSAKDWVEGLSALWGCGVSMERDNNNNEFVRFEQLDYFFRDVEVASFDFVSKYTRRPDLDKTFNEITFGFRKYPQDNEPDSLNDWMTVMNYITPIIRYKNKFEKLVPLMLSSYYIGYAQRESFKEKPTDTFETDNDIFSIDAESINTTYSGDIFIDLSTNQLTVYSIFPVVKDDNIVLNIGGSDIPLIVGSVEIPFAYDRTIITVIETLPGSGSGTVSGTVEIQLTTERFQAIRDEGFDVQGVTFQQSVYNLKHHIMRIVKRWAKYFSSGWSQYASERIRFVSGVNNTNVGTVISGSSCEPEEAVDYNSAGEWDDPLFSGDIIECEVDMDWTLFDTIRKAYENRHPDGKNYGYISVKNPDGEYVSGFPRRMSYNPTELKCKLQLAEKYGN
jgi:hypothetical protein